MGLGLLPIRMLSQEKNQADSLETEILAHGLFGAAPVVTLVEEKIDSLIDRLQSVRYIESVGELFDSS